MTDNEIIKALECCTDESYENCNECPYSIDTVSCERMKLLEDSLDFINRQKAEIKRLQKEVNLVSIQFQDLQERYEEAQSEIESLKKVVIDDYATEYDDKIKSEAVKEFAERLKNKIKTECNPYGKPTFDYDTSIAIMRYIDNLVKEMVGEK